jgi:DNA-binding transcriptional MerR regulator
MLTISQLADYAGVTVRAVRHYHQRGLLAEPARDASGYRRYDASAVVDLIRIRTLAQAGVPLARIEELLSAGPGQFTQAIAHIDKAMAARIRDLQQHRRRLAELAGGERLFLPADVVDLLDQLRAIGVSPRTVQMERDAWILAVALSPERVREWQEQKRSALASAEFRQLYLAYDQAFDWDPDDPRLAELADATVAYAVGQQPEARQAEPDWTAGEHVILALLESQIGNSSPSWERLNELGKARLRASGYPEEGTQPAARRAQR